MKAAAYKKEFISRMGGKPYKASKFVMGVIEGRKRIVKKYGI